LQERWHYLEGDERNPSRQAMWYLQGSDPQLKVVPRGVFFDAQKNTFILGRFATLEEAQRCAEAEAERMPTRQRRKREVRRTGEP
jgi:hypothetical protein